VVILKNVPVLTLSDHNSSRRFITLIDELYESDCCLVCSAKRGPLEMFDVEGDGAILEDERSLVDEAETSGTYVQAERAKRARRLNTRRGNPTAFSNCTFAVKFEASRRVATLFMMKRSVLFSFL